MSFGSTHFSQAFYDALSKAEQAGITIVVASGNSKLNLNNHEWYPTKYPHSNIITVAATNSQDQMWLGSSQGSNYSAKWVDVAAPGVSIYSTVNSGKYGTKTGTSMAAPVVSALAVLLKGKDSTLTPQEILVALKKSSEPLANLKDSVASGGRVNAYDAVELASRKSLLAADVAGTQCRR
jgi:subtilisin family serine protease